MRQKAKSHAFTKKTQKTPFREIETEKSWLRKRPFFGMLVKVIVTLENKIPLRVA